MNRSPDKANPFKRRGAGFLARDEVSSFFFFLLSVRGRKKFPSNDAYNILCGHKDLLKFPEIANLFERTGSVSGNERNIFTSHPDYLRIRFRYLNEEMRENGEGGCVVDGEVDA